MRSVIFTVLVMLSAVALAQQNRYLVLDPDNINTWRGTDYVSVPHSTDFLCTNFTIEAWTYRTQDLPRDPSYVFCKGRDVSTGSYGLSMNSRQGLTNAVTFSIRASSSPNPYAEHLDTETPLVGVWHHIAAVYDGGTGTSSLYVNGVLRDSSVRTPVVFPNNTSQVRIGQHEDGVYNYPWHGYLDEVRYWKVARTGAEIQRDMHVRLSGGEKNLIALWNFDDGTANDSTSNRHNGTLMGGATTALGAVPFDSDDDGLLDWWELEHFGDTISADPEADPDGDSYTNLEEFENGSDPNTFDVGHAMLWRAVEIGWKSVAGTNYQVQVATDMENPLWRPLYEFIGNGTTQTVLTSSRWDERRFFRIVPMTPPLTNGLIAKYTFDGSAADISGNGHHGTVYGAELTTETAHGVGSAYSFGGDGDYIGINSIGFSNISFSIAFWQKRSSAPLRNMYSFGAGGGVALLREDLNIGIKNSDGLEKLSSGFYADDLMFGSGLSSAEVWEFWCTTFDKDSLLLQFYFNGELVAEGPTEGVFQGVDGIVIGKGSYDVDHRGETYFDGIIDQLSIYNRALSSNEVKRLYFLQN
jgi:hypothetical protein